MHIYGGQLDHQKSGGTVIICSLFLKWEYISTWTHMHIYICICVTIANMILPPIRHHKIQISNTRLGFRLGGVVYAGERILTPFFCAQFMVCPKAPDNPCNWGLDIYEICFRNQTNTKKTCPKYSLLSVSWGIQLETSPNVLASVYRLSTEHMGIGPSFDEETFIQRCNLLC